MKTDTLFYELFQAAPQTFFELLQITPACPYRYESITVKATEKRIDGMLEPTAADQPIYFLEVQAFPDDVIYWRAMWEISTYFEQRPQFKGRAWQAIVLWLVSIQQSCRIRRLSRLRQFATVSKPEWHETLLNRYSG